MNPLQKSDRESCLF